VLEFEVFHSLAHGLLDDLSVESPLKAYQETTVDRSRNETELRGLKVTLISMADEDHKDELEKTEEPAPNCRKEARKKGQFAKSKNLIPAATLVAIGVAFRFGDAVLMVRMDRCIVAFFSAAGNLKQFRAEDLLERSMQAGWLFAAVLLPFFGGVVLAGLGSGFLQTGFTLGRHLSGDLEIAKPDVFASLLLTGINQHDCESLA
jgi:FlhB HrpN YscU SpaS Family